MKSRMKFWATAIAGLSGLLGTALVALAEDIDLFTGTSPTISPPTVLLVWHSTANSSSNYTTSCRYSDPNLSSTNDGKPDMGITTVAGMEQCVLVNTLLELKTKAALLGNIKIGLMMFNQQAFGTFDNGTTLTSPTTGDRNGNNNCGFLLSAPVLMDAAGIDAFVARIARLNHGDLANQSRVGDTIAEAWSMLNGLDYSCSGVDYSGLATVATVCRDAVMVYIGNAVNTASSVTDGNSAPDALLRTELSSKFGYSTSSQEYIRFTTPMAVTSLNNSGSANSNFWGDEWAQFMKHVNVDDRPAPPAQKKVKNVTTYSIAVYDPSANNIDGEVNFYRNLANKGGGKSFLVDSANSTALQEALMQIFNEVQAVNSVFASATLPVSANTQGTFLNQVYIAMFRPDASSQPRWYGNLKQYQFGFDSAGGIILTDSAPTPANGVSVSATNPITGTVVSSAKSFWTTNAPSPSVTGWPAGGANGSPDGFWRNSPAGDGFALDSPDGDLVQKGGAAQMLRVDNLTASYAGASQNGRKLYTCNTIGGCVTNLHEFKTTNTSLNTAAMGVSTSSSLSGVAMTAGRTFTGTYTACEGGNDKHCKVTYSGTDLDIAVGDYVDSTGDDGKCSASSPCRVRSVTKSAADVRFEYEYSGGQPTLPNFAVAFYLGKNIIKATIAGHSLVPNDTSVLSACQGTTDTNGRVFGADDTGGLPRTGTRAISVDSVDGDSFTFRLQVSAFIASGVTCTITTGLDKDALIKWVRGENNAGNEVDAGPCDGTACSTAITVRPSIHGDVLHSRPAVINYGGSTGAVVFYGSNDGVFRAINGNQTTSISGVRPGGELWGFIAPEFLGKLKRLYKNTPLVKIGATPASGSEPRDYFFDGTTTILQDNRTGTTTAGKKYIYLSARRGGPYIYAFDVTDPTAPKYLWSKSNTDIAELGQTWSQPKVAIVEGHANPVVIFGAGYDPAEDVQPGDAPPAGTDTTIDSGRGIIVLDSVNGSLVWAALANCGSLGASCVDSAATTDADGDIRLSHAFTHPVAADITLMDNDSDGYIDRLYAADTGGNIWRVDLQPGGDSSPSNWTTTKFASLAGTGNNARKFLFAPDVVPTKNFDIVVASSGDREHPLVDTNTTAGRAYNVNNRFYVLIDENGGDSVASGTAVIDESTLVNHTTSQCLAADGSGAAVNCTYDVATDSYKDGSNNVVSLLSIAAIGSSASFDGYYFTLEGNTVDGASEGEKGINAPLAVAGKVFFGTNQPDTSATSACTAGLGIARGYKVDLFTGQRQVNIFSGGGLPPSPIAGLVTIDGKTVPFVIGGEGPSAFDPSVPELDLAGGRNRTYWYYK